MRMRARTTGDYGVILTALNNFEQNALRVAQDVVEEIAQEFLDFLKESLENGMLDLSPLSEEYLRRKVDAGLDHRILISTREYIESFQVVRTPEGVFAGIPEGVQHSSGVEMASLARWLEEGTPNMPARPHIEPSWEMFWSQARSRLRKRINEEVGKMWGGMY